MALMFPRLARNFAKAGYYPTDVETLERTLRALKPADEGMMRILDPCAGEGLAIAEAAHHLERGRVHAVGVEYDVERARHMASLVDRPLQGDLMDTVISPRTMGLLWLNPPYGDLVSDHSGASLYRGKGRPRLEKLFYQRTIGTLQYGGVLVLIIPHSSLDKELVGWLTSHFTELRIWRAAVDDFKQVVITGVRAKRDQALRREHKVIKADMIRIGAGETKAPVIPDDLDLEPYIVPRAKAELKHCYRITMEPEQMREEITQLRGLWSDYRAVFAAVGHAPRPPARRLSPWHLALSLAAGAISGVVTSPSGRCLVVKGDTHKEKVSTTEFTENDDGSVNEIRVMTDRFVPVIRAWDMTPGSEHFGQILTISSTPAETDAGESPDDRGEAPDTPRFDLGRVVMTHSINALLEEESLSRGALLQVVGSHHHGNWGVVSAADWEANEAALIQGGRLVSRYELGGTTILVITEADRSATTLMLPEDY